MGAVVGWLWRSGADADRFDGSRGAVVAHMIPAHYYESKVTVVAERCPVCTYSVTAIAPSQLPGEDERARQRTQRAVHHASH
ncbi:hypothetical protein L210DRAFT_950821 [Boletus edulis BED1]|uniref:Uncharacterized protein n=1 Tax=Boletus edulis BED1 TaxID=1328754 RepID=A0AAD4BDE6_BOLED|nr:hypothetical protein L210DRAFT_950821 [Boletus edulis BED1]